LHFNVYAEVIAGKAEMPAPAPDGEAPRPKRKRKARK
jgi:hypothetical protein